MHSIGTASKLSGIHVETIRFYEREGLIPAPRRSASGHRYFDDAAIATLKFIGHCRAARFPLREIRKLLALRARSGTACAASREIGLSHARKLRETIDTLLSLEAELTTALEKCDSTRSDCALIRELERDEIGEFRSPGPVSPL